MQLKGCTVWQNKEHKVHTIGIIGATGSIGTELCVTLRQFEGVRVIAICRSKLGSALLKRCGVEVRVGVIEDQQQAKQLLADCDTVVDLSLPRGTAYEFRKASQSIIENAITFSPAGARFIYASTYMAYGMREPQDRVFRNYLFSRNVYGTNKRWAEKNVRRVASRAAVSAYVLRFGQVHGEIQSCTQRLSAGGAVPHTPYIVPAGPSNTVFVFTLAEAIVNIAQGLEAPGTYTLVSVPQWTWKEVVEHACSSRGAFPNAIEVPVGPPHRWQVANSIRQFFVRAVLWNRDVLAGYILVHFPAIEMRAKALNLMRRAREEASSARIPISNEVLRSAYHGEAPGRRLTSLTDSRKSMAPYAALVRQTFDSVVIGTRPPTAADTIRFELG